MSAGFSQAVRAAIIDRDGGLCRRCGAPGQELHHRRGRGAGGTSKVSVNGPANGVTLCRRCHVWAESHRAEAYATGWAVRRSDIRSDAAIPMTLSGGAELWLDDDGTAVVL